MLEFLLAGGPAPACFAGADATADGALDMTDAIVSLELLVRGVSPPESRLFVELEEPRNAGCPWSRITPERQRKTEDCPNGCEPILPPRSRCGWYKEALFDLYCFRSWCIWVPTCEWVYCCYVCADTC